MTEYDNPTAEALTLWMEIIGIDPASTSFNLGSYDLRRQCELLREALDLDPTEITANLMLDYYARSHFEATKVSQAELMADAEGIFKKLEKPRRLLALLERPEIVERRRQFIGHVTQALEAYDASGRDDVKAVLADHDRMAFLRRDALRSMEKLSVHQFLDGDPEPASVRPVYYKFVHQWFNINSMLEASARQAPGVSLNLIRDPNDYQSYFCFAIRNGGRLFVLSDAPDDVHPMQAMLSRRPDREMQQRVARNWFPYDLMGIAFNEEDGRLYIDRSDEKSLVVGQSEALPLKPISKIGPEEVIWTAMMFGLIVDRFWRRGHTEKALSYTAEMVRVEDKMIAAATKSGLPVKGYATIDAKPLTVDDVMNPDAETALAYGKRKSFDNVWLEQRYGHLVSDESLNLISSPERKHVLRLSDGTIDNVRHVQTDFRMGGDRSVATVQVQKLPSTFFGTKERVEADRLYVARYNYAIQIDALARNEFEKRKDEVVAWYRKKVDANVETLKTWIGDRILWLPSNGEMSQRTGMGYHPTSGTPMRSFGFPWALSDDYQRRINLGFGSYYIGGLYKGAWQCVENDTKATFAFTFCPANAKELCVVAGCDETELPDVLVNFKAERAREGNQLLNRTDPAEWAIDDPWSGLDMRVGFFLSKRGFAKLAANSVVPPYCLEVGVDTVTRQEWRQA